MHGHTDGVNVEKKTQSCLILEHQQLIQSYALAALPIEEMGTPQQPTKHCFCLLFLRPHRAWTHMLGYPTSQAHCSRRHGT